MTELLCDHGYPMGKCPDEGCLHRREVKNALLGLAGSVTAADDQARAMTDAELADRLLTGRWSTIEVHEAGRRLADRSRSGPPTDTPQDEAESANPADVRGRGQR